MRNKIIQERNTLISNNPNVVNGACIGNSGDIKRAEVDLVFNGYKGRIKINETWLHKEAGSNFMFVKISVLYWSIWSKDIAFNMSVA